MPELELRMTVAVATLLRAFLDDPTHPRYGYDLMKVTGFPSGKMYPLLGRLLAAKWLEKQREHIDPHAEGRPPRYWYRLTESGAVAARQALAELYQQIGPAPRPATVG